MPHTSELDSAIFRHLTRKAKPALAHPTAKAFEPNDWKPVIASIGEDALTPRDRTLVNVAMLIGLQNLVLRTRYTATLFAGFTEDQIATLAIANANRRFLLLGDTSRAATAQAAAAAKAESGRPLDFGAISQLLVEPAPGQSPATVDDLNNSMIDTLPHWFALAREVPEGPRPAGENLGGVAQRAGAILSLEHAFRSVWQEALWESWRFGKTSTGYAMMPDDADWKAGWRVWDLREQSLLLQGAMLNRQLEEAIPNAHKTPTLPLTITAINFTAEPLAIAVGPPSDDQATGHRMALDTLDDAYTRMFADQEVGGPGVTVALLSRVVLVLQDLTELALPSEYDPAEPDWKVMERLACKLPRALLIEAIAEALATDPAVAERCVAFLTTDPLAELGELFRIGLWHKPLVATSDGAHVLIAAGALIWGSPIRRTERWLQVKNGDDLSKTPNGMLYEAQVRRSVDGALEDNSVLTADDWHVTHLPKGKGKEEIDLLVRVGDRVLVAEIKCLLGPSEPSECYNYLRKLEKAAEQARRKATWLASEPALIEALFGSTVALETIPLVVVNQSNGVGLTFEGCQVTDAHFLRIVLGEGDYHMGAKFNGEAPIALNVVTLYKTVDEAAALLRHVFADHLGLRRFRAAVRWTSNDIPLAGNDGKLSIAYPVVDEAAYFAAGPFAVEANAEVERPSGARVC